MFENSEFLLESKFLNFDAFHSGAKIVKINHYAFGKTYNIEKNT